MKVSDEHPNLTDEELKNKLIKETKTKPTSSPENKFPTEPIDLPSKGLVYPKDNPLSSGVIEMRYMTAKEEDILTSQTLIKKGIVLDKLFESLIVTDINYDDLTLGDKNAIMIAARVLGYGKDYKVEMACPNCDVKNKLNIDLTQLKDVEVDESRFEQGKNEFEFKLPHGKRTITYKLLTHADEKLITQELKALRKLDKDQDHDFTTRLKYTITSVDGDHTTEKVRHFVDEEFFSMDTREFRKHLAATTPDVDATFDYECEECNHEIPNHTIPLTVDFFWPRA